MANYSNTYCIHCDKECKNGANWSSHIASAKHIRLAGTASSSNGEEYDFDDIEDSWENVSEPRAPTSPSIWDTPSTSRGHITPSTIIANAALPVPALKATMRPTHGQVIG